MPAVGQQSVQRLPVDNQHPSKGVALGSAQTVAIPVAPTDRPDPDKTWAQVPGEIPASSSCGLFFCSPRPFEADFLPRICVFVEFCVSLSANPRSLLCRSPRLHGLSCLWHQRLSVCWPRSTVSRKTPQPPGH